jgi:hypothetical protein
MSRNDNTMKTNALIAITSLVLGFSPPVFAGTTYQATGPVLELTDSKIIIQKETEKWEFARTPDTKVTGTLKVGEKVTVHYSMTATSIETKSAKPAPASAEKEKPAKKKAP